MKISNNVQFNFKGYDIIPLKALYMQGIRKDGEAKVCNEISDIAKKEGFNLLINQDCKKFTRMFTTPALYNVRLSLWGQDNKSFVMNGMGKCILWNTKESLMEPNCMGELSDYNMYAKKYLPRGGNYYLGQKENGEKWILINGTSIVDDANFDEYCDKPTRNHICKFFDVKPENIFVIDDFVNDIDEIVRPIGFPYILVNDYKLSLKNLEKMKGKFPASNKLYNRLKHYINMQLYRETTSDIIPSCDKVCKILEKSGFRPIRIAGRFNEDINYMNAIAFQNNRDKISYITNSTKYSYPELDYLEKLFEDDLRNKISRVSDVYFVSGGRRNPSEESGKFHIFLEHGLENRNNIMDILANKMGGVHCMCAEIPDFDKLKKIPNQ